MDTPASLFRLAHFVWESQPGRYALTAVVHGTVRLAQGQEASFVAPEVLPLGYDETQTLVARLNLLAPFKPKLDVVVVGKAYAPPASESDRLIARIRIGDFSKAVSITGDRLWMRDGARWGSSPPRPFSQMLLSPERAIRSAENPVGLDPAAIPVEGRLAMPNLEPAGGSFSAVTGTVAPTAPSRHNLLDAAGIYWVAALEAGRAPGPLPEGFNFQFFNVAPQDQQVATISPGDAVVLENLHPMYPVFTTKLPSVLPRIVGVDGTTGSTFEVPIRCDTVWLDGDRETAWIVYRGTAAVARPDQPLALRVEVERYKRPEPQQLSTSTMLQTQQGSGHAVMPFANSHSSAAPSYGAYGQYAQPNQAALQRPIASEVTSELPAEGSYPPPPPRHITQEIELEAPAAEASPGGLPFGGGLEHRSVARTEPGWAGNGFPTGQPAYANALAPQPTMALELPGRHETMPPAPPSMALPFGPLPVEPTAPHSVKTLFVQKSSPGPIPDIGPTAAPVIALVMREPAPPSMSELTIQPTLLSLSKQPAEPTSVVAPPPIVAPAAPPPVAPAAPPVVAPPVVAPPVVAPPVVAPPVVAPPVVAPPVVAPPVVAPPVVAPPVVAPPVVAPPVVAPPVVAPPVVAPPVVAPPVVAPPVVAPPVVAPPVVAPPPPMAPAAPPATPVSPPSLSSPSALPIAPPMLSPPRVPLAPPIPAVSRVDEAPLSTRVPPPAPSVPVAVVVPPSLRPAAPVQAVSTDPPMPPPMPKPTAVPLNLVPPPKPNRVVEPAPAEAKATNSPPPQAAPAEVALPQAQAPSFSAFADDPTPPADEPFAEVQTQAAEPAPAADPAPPAEPTPPQLEDVAALRARLSFKDADKAGILASFGLEDGSWIALEREHLKAIDEASQAGNSSLLERYDDAYLETLNQLRGLIDELGYARLQYARESGSLGTTLEELRVQRNDLMRLERTWRRRLAANKELAERVEDELERLRGGGA